MNSRHLRIWLLGTTIGISSSLNLFAQYPVGFSRACAFSSVTYGGQLLYHAVTGQTSTVNGLVEPLYQLTEDVKTRFWANESITIDWGGFRYWLLAYSGQYLNGARHSFYQSYWNAESRWDNNRGLWSSARAGHNMSAPNGATAGMFEYKQDGTWKTLGVHYTFDPVTGQLSYLGVSSATNCNCTQWGFWYTPYNALMAVPACLL